MLCQRYRNPHPTVPYCDRFIEMPFDRSPLSRKNLQVYRSLKQLMDTEHYALIHCNTPTGGLVGRLAARSARKHGTRVVYTAHGFHFFHGAPVKNYLLYYPAERWLSRFTDLLITINREDEAAAAKFHAAKTARISGIGVALERFAHPADRAATRSMLGIAADAPLLITVGEHSHRKNHAVILQAMQHLPPQTELLLCGVGSLQPQLEALAETLGIAFFMSLPSLANILLNEAPMETVNHSSSFTVDLISSAIFIPSPWMSLLWVTSSQHSSIP